jgi:hypothetical protein
MRHRDQIDRCAPIHTTAGKAPLFGRRLAATQEPASRAHFSALWSTSMAAAAKGLSDERAARFMVALREGTTPHIFGVNKKSLEIYPAAHPDYAREARPLLEANAVAARRRKGERIRKLTENFCLKGLHPMKGNNLMSHKGRRVCRACWRHHATHPPIHSILPVLDLSCCRFDGHQV